MELRKGGIFLVRDIILNKVQIIERCLERINEEYDNNEENLRNYTKQDSIILNIQRMCEACIDLAMHYAAEHKLGIPQSSRDVFDLLNQAGVISQELASSLKKMVGFRNIAVHDYQNINLDIVKNIIDKDLKDIKEFAGVILKQ
jgi:uncharacterized protein YutE (UPF0331/DUF86 family)